MKSDDTSFGIDRRTLAPGLALLAKTVRAQGFGRGLEYL